LAALPLAVAVPDKPGVGLSAAQSCVAQAPGGEQAELEQPAVEPAMRC